MAKKKDQFDSSNLEEIIEWRKVTNPASSKAIPYRTTVLQPDGSWSDRPQEFWAPQEINLMFTGKAGTHLDRFLYSAKNFGAQLVPFASLTDMAQVRDAITHAGGLTYSVNAIAHLAAHAAEIKGVDARGITYSAKAMMELEDAIDQSLGIPANNTAEKLTNLWDLLHAHCQTVIAGTDGVPPTHVNVERSFANYIHPFIKIDGDQPVVGSSHNAQEAPLFKDARDLMAYIETTVMGGDKPVEDAEKALKKISSYARGDVAKKMLDAPKEWLQQVKEAIEEGLEVPPVSGQDNSGQNTNYGTKIINRITASINNPHDPVCIAVQRVASTIDTLLNEVYGNDAEEILLRINRNTPPGDQLTKDQAAIVTAITEACGQVHVLIKRDGGGADIDNLDAYTDPTAVFAKLTSHKNYNEKSEEHAEIISAAKKAKKTAMGIWKAVLDKDADVSEIDDKDALVARITAACRYPSAPNEYEQQLINAAQDGDNNIKNNIASLRRTAKQIVADAAKKSGRDVVITAAQKAARNLIEQTALGKGNHAADNISIRDALCTKTIDSAPNCVASLLKQVAKNKIAKDIESVLPEEPGISPDWWQKKPKRLLDARFTLSLALRALEFNKTTDGAPLVEPLAHLEKTLSLLKDCSNATGDTLKMLALVAKVREFPRPADTVAMTDEIAVAAIASHLKSIIKEPTLSDYALMAAIEAYARRHIVKSILDLTQHVIPHDICTAITNAGTYSHAANSDANASISAITGDANVPSSVAVAVVEAKTIVDNLTSEINNEKDPSEAIRKIMAVSDDNLTHVTIKNAVNEYSSSANPPTLNGVKTAINNAAANAIATAATRAATREIIDTLKNFSSLFPSGQNDIQTAISQIDTALASGNSITQIIQAVTRHPPLASLVSDNDGNAISDPAPTAVAAVAMTALNNNRERGVPKNNWKTGQQNIVPDDAPPLDKKTWKRMEWFWWGSKKTTLTSAQETLPDNQKIELRKNAVEAAKRSEYRKYDLPINKEAAWILEREKHRVLNTLPHDRTDYRSWSEWIMSNIWLEPFGDKHYLDLDRNRIVYHAFDTVGFNRDAFEASARSVGWVTPLPGWFTNSLLLLPGLLTAPILDFYSQHPITATATATGIQVSGLAWNPAISVHLAHMISVRSELARKAGTGERKGKVNAAKQFRELRDLLKNSHQRLKDAMEDHQRFKDANYPTKQIEASPPKYLRPTSAKNFQEAENNLIKARTEAWELENEFRKKQQRDLCISYGTNWRSFLYSHARAIVNYVGPMLNHTLENPFISLYSSYGLQGVSLFLLPFIGMADRVNRDTQVVGSTFLFASGINKTAKKQGIGFDNHDQDHWPKIEESLDLEEFRSSVSLVDEKRIRLIDRIRIQDIRTINLKLADLYSRQEGAGIHFPKFQSRWKFLTMSQILQRDIHDFEDFKSKIVRNLVDEADYTNPVDHPTRPGLHALRRANLADLPDDAARKKLLDRWSKREDELSLPLREKDLETLEKLEGRFENQRVTARELKELNNPTPAAHESEGVFQVLHRYGLPADFPRRRDKNHWNIFCTAIKEAQKQGEPTLEEGRAEAAMDLYRRSLGALEWYEVEQLKVLRAAEARTPSAAKRFSRERQGKVSVLKELEGLRASTGCLKKDQMNEYFILLRKRMAKEEGHITPHTTSSDWITFDEEKKLKDFEEKILEKCNKSVGVFNLIIEIANQAATGLTRQEQERWRILDAHIKTAEAAIKAKGGNDETTLNNLKQERTSLHEDEVRLEFDPPNLSPSTFENMEAAMNGGAANDRMLYWRVLKARVNHQAWNASTWIHRIPSQNNLYGLAGTNTTLAVNSGFKLHKAIHHSEVNFGLKLSLSTAFYILRVSALYNSANMGAFRSDTRSLLRKVGTRNPMWKLTNPNGYARLIHKGMLLQVHHLRDCWGWQYSDKGAKWEADRLVSSVRKADGQLDDARAESKSFWQPKPGDEANTRPGGPSDKDPSATISSRKNTGVQFSSSSKEAKDKAEKKPSAPRMHEHDDTGVTGEELHVTTATPSPFREELDEAYRKVAAKEFVKFLEQQGYGVDQSNETLGIRVAAPREVDIDLMSDLPMVVELATERDYLSDEKISHLFEEFHSNNADRLLDATKIEMLQQLEKDERERFAEFDPETEEMSYDEEAFQGRMDIRGAQFEVQFDEEVGNIVGNEFIHHLLNEDAIEAIFAKLNPEDQKALGNNLSVDNVITNKKFMALFFEELEKDGKIIAEDIARFESEEEEAQKRKEVEEPIFTADGTPLIIHTEPSVEEPYSISEMHQIRVYNNAMALRIPELAPLFDALSTYGRAGTGKYVEQFYRELAERRTNVVTAKHAEEFAQRVAPAFVKDMLAKAQHEVIDATPVPTNLPLEPIAATASPHNQNLAAQTSSSKIFKGINSIYSEEELEEQKPQQKHSRNNHLPEVIEGNRDKVSPSDIEEDEQLLQRLSACIRDIDTMAEMPELTNDTIVLTFDQATGRETTPQNKGQQALPPGQIAVSVIDPDQMRKVLSTLPHNISKYMLVRFAEDRMLRNKHENWEKIATTLTSYLKTWEKNQRSFSCSFDDFSTALYHVESANIKPTDFLNEHQKLFRNLQQIDERQPSHLKQFAHYVSTMKQINPQMSLDRCSTLYFDTVHNWISNRNMSHKVEILETPEEKRARLMDQLLKSPNIHLAENVRSGITAGHLQLSDKVIDEVATLFNRYKEKKCSIKLWQGESKPDFYGCIETPVFTGEKYCVIAPRLDRSAQHDTIVICNVEDLKRGLKMNNKAVIDKGDYVGSKQGVVGISRRSKTTKVPHKNKLDTSNTRKKAKVQ